MPDGHQIDGHQLCCRTDKYTQDRATYPQLLKTTASLDFCELQQAGILDCNSDWQKLIHQTLTVNIVRMLQARQYYSN